MSPLGNSGGGVTSCSAVSLMSAILRDDDGALANADVVVLLLLPPHRLDRT